MRNAVIQRTLCNLIASGVLALAASLSAAQPDALIRPRPKEMVGTLSCAAASCHGGSGPQSWSGAGKGTEYVHWLGAGGVYSEGRRAYDPRARLIKTDGDPHAHAAQRMSEPRFQEVLRRASGRSDDSIDPTMLVRCAKCHDPLAGASSVVVPEEIAVPTIPNSQPLALLPNEPSLDHSERLHGAAITGIGCETCHGGARQWLTIHYQSGIRREDLLRLGMIDTKNLLVRAKLCASCHVGSAEQDMNHDMIAAGHPPLRFEQASYEALLGRKHWDDAPARSANPNYEVQLWAAGRLAAAQAATALLAARSQESAVASHQPWPEFAESNCLACHQPLQTPDGVSLTVLKSDRRRSPPAWQTWNTALLEAALLPRAARAGELPRPSGSWSATMDRLRTAMEQSTVPDRNQIAALTEQATFALERAGAGQHLALSASSLLQTIGDAEEKAIWDELCQRVAALTAARRALWDQGRLSVAGNRQIEQRIERVATSLRFVATDREWPVIYSEISTSSTADLLRELAQIRQDLLFEARR